MEKYEKYFLCRKNTWDAPRRVSYACLQLLKRPLERESVPWVPRQRMSYALCSLFRSHSPASFECNVSMGHMLHLLYLSAFCSVLSWKSVQLFQKRNETLSHVCKAFVLVVASAVVVVIINNNQFPVCAPQEMFPIVPHLGEKSAMKTDSTKMEIFVMKLKLRGRQAPFPERTCCAASPLLLALPPLSICFLCSVLFAVFPQKNICAHLAVAHLHFIFTTHTVWQQLQGKHRESERVRVSVGESAAQPMAGDSQLLIALQPHEGSRGCRSRSEVKRRPNQRAPTTFIVVADACVVSHISPSLPPSLFVKFFFLGDFVWFMSWPNNNNNHNTPSCVQLSPCNLNELPAPRSSPARLLH